MAKPKPDTFPSIYRIKITLGDVDPPVWRRVEIEDCSLQTLHGVVQDAMGWENYHLYEFHVGDEVYTEPRAVDEDSRSAAETTLAELVGRKCTQFDYVYDLGDEWGHRLEIEAAAPPEPGVHYPRCVEGQRACPPEDCGGPWRYKTMLEALKDPRHEEHEEFLEWIGDTFDSEAFDAQRVNRVWANWNFSDPNSGPSYEEQDGREPEPEEPRVKTKNKVNTKPVGQSRVGKNDPCPCGSGKKYKKCCMKRGKDGEFEE